MSFLKGKIYIGTSGWVYSHWVGKFYPKKLPSSKRLEFFSRYFNTTEINYSFYHLPRKTTFQRWYFQTPKEFIFAVKASRFITHIKRLRGVKEAWREFFENAKSLKEKLGPILFQLPPSFKASQENIESLKKFLKILSEDLSSRHPFLLRFAFEFRHRSWIEKQIFDLLKKYNISWVIADSSRYPKSETITADFVYLRMHGPGALFASKYTKKELEDLAKKIKKWQKEKRDIYVYFNNDFYGYAIQNAQYLKKLLKL